MYLTEYYGGIPAKPKQYYIYPTFPSKRVGEIPIQSMTKAIFQENNPLGRIIPQIPRNRIEYTDYTHPAPVYIKGSLLPDFRIIANTPQQAQSRAKSFWYDYLVGTTPQEKIARENHAQL